ncbi:MAG TPA: 30S ribosomal protein S21 [Desulfohalobiaceae bacterium]|nr:30S ribosomal protein S21 [Desulfohalobiaceae bacterium]
MTEVIINDNDNFERALRLFKRKVSNEGLPTEFKKRKYYEKPCERRKRKEAASQRRIKRRVQRWRSKTPAT